MTTSIGGERLRRVHAHVERRVETVREAPFGTVELRAADTEIEKHPDHVPLFVLRQNFPELPEPSLHHFRTVTELAEPFSGGGHGVGVTIDSEEPEIGARFEQQRGVTTAAHRRVHDQSRGDGEEQFDDLPPHHRDMVELALHVDPLSRRARRAVAPDPSPAPRAAGASRDVSPGRGYG